MSTATRPPQAPQANPALLHRALGGGQVIMVLALAIARSSGIMLDGAGSASPAASALVIASALMLASALIVLKPRVPRRRAGLTREAFWGDANVSTPAMLFWFILEGSAVVASVAYFLSASLLSAALALIAIAAFWMNGPARFENE
jgi:hypothetical protein